MLRDGFDAKLWNEAWERDLEADSQSVTEPGAKKLYTALVPDQGHKVSYPYSYKTPSLLTSI